MKTPLKTSFFACLLSLLPFVKAFSQPAWNTVYTENFNNVSSPDAVPNMYYGCSFAISGSGGNKYLRNSWAVEYCFVLFKLNLDAAYEYRMTCRREAMRRAEMCSFSIIPRLVLAARTSAQRRRSTSVPPFLPI
ncbi:MAG: hypothetical protein JNK77_04630 [Saprospiraceae bacterium]|nr:hypothetical protein [Saprospiraceae bacterium]